MATTVFPETDDTVTEAAWSAMIAALDRGAVDVLSDSTPDDGYDSARLLFDYNDTASITNDTLQDIVSVNIDKGQCYAGTFNCEIENDASSSDDNFVCAVTVPTGVRAYIYGHRKQGFATNSVTSLAQEKTAVTDDNILMISFSSFVGQVQSLRLTLVLFGESASGTTKIRMAKSGNSYPAESYEITKSRLSLRRIW
jgi:hypothetical protein